MNQRLHSDATYEYSYPVGARNVSAWLLTIRMCLHRSRMRIYMYI